MVTWQDAAASSGWFSEERARSYLPYVVQSVGWLIRKDSKIVVLALSKQERTQQYGDTLDIPRGMVRKIRLLK